jgi:hypothetical protein
MEKMGKDKDVRSEALFKESELERRRKGNKTQKISPKENVLLYCVELKPYSAILSRRFL